MCRGCSRRTGRGTRPARITEGFSIATAPRAWRRRGLGRGSIAADLAALGITVDCLPLADVPVADADPVIGSRAYGTSPAKVAAIAAAVAQGLIEGGVLPVLKHLPGHGRATVDSHKSLPVVNADRQTLDAVDFAAFRPLAGLVLGMTAHVVFSGIRPGRTGHDFGHNGAGCDSVIRSGSRAC